MRTEQGGSHRASSGILRPILETRAPARATNLLTPLLLLASEKLTLGGIDKGVSRSKIVTLPERCFGCSSNGTAHLG